MKPQLRPRNPRFSSGPCTKRPGWTPDFLKHAFLGRSHRAALGKAKLKQAIEQTRQALGIPENYLIGIVPASDTGAVEMALWSLLGGRPVDVLVWESFGKGWATDVLSQLKIEDVRIIEAPYGELPNLDQVNFSADLVFTWNGTTSGVCVPDGDWIPDNRAGLTICDATSAAFSMDLPWSKLDCTTFSWQKALGGEAAHGMLILSPRAVERLEAYKPQWPLPKIFRLTKGGKIISGIFEGETINTPSMMAVEDYLDALDWALHLGGVKALVKRTNYNASILGDFVSKSDWIDYLAKDQTSRSTTSICLVFSDPQVARLSEERQREFAKAMCKSLEQEEVAFDIGAYRDAPPGLRIWAGATVESDDLLALLPWLDWAFVETKKNFFGQE